MTSQYKKNAGNSRVFLTIIVKIMKLLKTVRRQFEHETYH